MSPFDPWQPSQRRYPLAPTRTVRVPVRRAEVTPPPASSTAASETSTGQEAPVATTADTPEAARQRIEKRLLTEAEQARQTLLRDMLPVADHLRAALAHINQPHSQPEQVREGVERILHAFQETLRRHGVIAINAEGAAFDPNWHEALGMEAADAPAGYVAQVVEQGYTVDGALLRPARVLVSSGPAIPTEA